MSNEDIADALGTTFIEDENLNEIQDIEDIQDQENLPMLPIQVDSSLVAVSAVPDDFDTEESVYIREKLRTVTEKSGQFFDMVANEFRQAPTSKMAESAGKILDTQVSALGKLVEIDENRKKRKSKTQPAMKAGGNINVTQNNIVASREDLLKAIKEQEVINVTPEKE